MNNLNKIFMWVVGLVISLYLIVVFAFYLMQEKILFHPTKLAEKHVFSFPSKFEELNISMKDETILNGLLFKSDSTKGLVIYFHGNADDISNWGYDAKPFTDNNYDCFMIDYRGYGKSQGKISSEKQLLEDVSAVYKELTTRYSENDIIILGYSIGTGLASYLAANNKPKKLILLAPYNNLNYLRKLYFKWLPGFALKYKLTTDEYLKNNSTSVTIFHGFNDELIPYQCSLELEKEFDNNDELIKLYNQGHNGIGENEVFLTNIRRILK